MIKMKIETPLTKDMTRDVLYENTRIHRTNVRNILEFMANEIDSKSSFHDQTKFGPEDVDDDYFEMMRDMINGNYNKNNTWFKEHQQNERHHLKNEEFIDDDVNLFDVLEMIADGVAAGYGRKGCYEHRDDLSDNTLKKAYLNTVKLINRICQI